MVRCYNLVEKYLGRYIMTREQYLKNLKAPGGRVDVILDTDAFNEIDDQFAIAYLLASGEKLNTVGVCAAPFYNSLSSSPEDGMNKSFDEIHKLLELVGREELKERTFRGSTSYLPDESTPVESDAADFIVETARKYSPEAPLYVVAIGAITNVASAILKDPKAMENTVVVWLGGHCMGCDWREEASEFNMAQDIAGARVLFGSATPLVMLPCEGVVSAFTLSGAECEHWLRSTNPVGDYLCANTISAAEKYAAGTPWTRVIWDVTAVAWLLGTPERNSFMATREIRAMLPEYDKSYSYPENGKTITYVTKIHRDRLMTDLIEKIRGYNEGSADSQ